MISAPLIRLDYESRSKADISAGGYEYALVLLLASLGLAMTGGGALSLKR